MFYVIHSSIGRLGIAVMMLSIVRSLSESQKDELADRVRESVSVGVQLWLSHIEIRSRTIGMVYFLASLWQEYTRDKHLRS